MNFYSTLYNTLRHPVDDSPNPNSVGNSKAGYEEKVFWKSISFESRVESMSGLGMSFLYFSPSKSSSGVFFVRSVCYAMLK